MPDDRTAGTADLPAWSLPPGAVASVYDRRCASRQALDRIGDKWSALITGALVGGPVRFNELHRAVSGVSPKMLAQTLRSLERDGFTTRHVVPTVPPQVSYALTPLGEDLEALHAQVRRWAETHIEQIETARLRWEVVVDRR